MIYLYVGWTVWVVVPWVLDLLGYRQRKLNVFDAYCNLQLCRKYEQVSKHYN